jgi:hypothetical protein
MPKFDPEDINLQTVLHKHGDRAFQPMVCGTLGEAMLEVGRWPKSEQAKARFRITGKDKGYEYTTADLPHA